MNCSTISLTRTAATNGCSALNSTYLSATAVKASTLNGNNNGKTLHTINNSLLNGNNHPAKANLVLNSNILGSHNINVLQPTISTTMSTKVDDKCKNVELALQIIKDSNIVCFDVDSTVICEEGIDELADYCGKGSEVARVTKEAMGGSMTFQDALQIRLNIIRPSQKQIRDFVQERPSTLTRNVKNFIEHLKSEGKQIYLISGGFECLIEPVANELGIPLSNLYANKLMFYFNGDYAGFDKTQPTSKSGGKPEVISMIKEQNPNDLITMIGDGATDLEAVPPANYVIGFGGNVIRNEVQKRAHYYITDFDQLM